MIHARASFNIKYKYRRGEIKNEASCNKKYVDIYIAVIGHWNEVYVTQIYYLF